MRGHRSGLPAHVVRERQPRTGRRRAGRPDASDAALIRSARLGDEQAFRQIVDRYGRQMFRYALRLVGGSETDAGEVVQEAFISAWRSLPTFRGDSGLRTWLFRLVHRRAVDLMRRRRPTPVDDAALVDLVAPTLDNAIQHVLDEELLARLARGAERTTVAPARRLAPARDRGAQLRGDRRRARIAGEQRAWTAAPRTQDPGREDVAMAVEQGTPDVLARAVEEARREPFDDTPQGWVELSDTIMSRVRGLVRPGDPILVHAAGGGPDQDDHGSRTYVSTRVVVDALRRALMAEPTHAPARIDLSLTDSRLRAVEIGLVATYGVELRPLADQVRVVVLDTLRALLGPDPELDGSAISVEVVDVVVGDPLDT